MPSSSLKSSVENWPWTTAKLVLKEEHRAILSRRRSWDCPQAGTPWEALKNGGVGPSHVKARVQWGPSQPHREELAFQVRKGFSCWSNQRKSRATPIKRAKGQSKRWGEEESGEWSWRALLAALKFRNFGRERWKCISVLILVFWQTHTSMPPWDGFLFAWNTLSPIFT